MVSLYMCISEIPVDGDGEGARDYHYQINTISPLDRWDCILSYGSRWMEPLSIRSFSPLMQRIRRHSWEQYQRQRTHSGQDRRSLEEHE